MKTYTKAQIDQIARHHNWARVELTGDGNLIRNLSADGDYGWGAVTPEQTAEALDTMITAIGEALWGSRWQTDMATALGVSDRTVRRWAAGSERPRSGVYVDLKRLCVDRAAALDDIIDRL